jgi:hypothetical protein
VHGFGCDVDLDLCLGVDSPNGRRHTLCTTAARQVFNQEVHWAILSLVPAWTKDEGSSWGKVKRIPLLNMLVDQVLTFPSLEA